jgi:hypothetical protein
MKTQVQQIYTCFNTLSIDKIIQTQKKSIKHGKAKVNQKISTKFGIMTKKNQKSIK